MQTVIDVVQELADEVGKPRWDWIVPEKNSDLDLRLREIASEALTEAYQVTVKSERSEKISQTRQSVCDSLVEEGFSEEEIKTPIQKIREGIVSNFLKKLQNLMDITVSVGVFYGISLWYFIITNGCWCSNIKSSCRYSNGINKRGR